MNAAQTPPKSERLVLRSDVLDVVVLPRKGADIYSIIDRISGIDVLFKSPWGWRDPDALPRTGDSQRDWLARYPGGWQQLVPNAGQPRCVDGVERGYHGEAAVTPWQVQARTHDSARLTTGLRSAPLSLTRTLVLDGPTLHITDIVMNDSAAPTEVMWVQHPGFGAPFVDGSCTLDFDAATLISDAEEPGTALAIDTSYDVSAATTEFSRKFRHVPAPNSASSSFGCLTDFRSGWFRIDSPHSGFGIRVDWDADVFPHAWFWQECHASTGYPWFGEAYVVAIEPANVLPGDPSPGCRHRGRAPLIAPGQARISRLSVSRTSLVR